VKQYYVPKISAKLTELDPAGAATFSANASAYGGKLDTLDTDLNGMVAQIPPRTASSSPSTTPFRISRGTFASN